MSATITRIRPVAPVRALHAVLPTLMRDREERRRVNVRAIDLSRERNERDCCADCGEQLGIRVRVAYDPHTTIVRCLSCASGVKFPKGV